VLASRVSAANEDVRSKGCARLLDIAVALGMLLQLQLQPAQPVRVWFRAVASA
jgi:hypothetical protein